MYVLVGLGNPGSQYALNRHNVGFMAIDVIADAYSFPPFKSKFNAAVSEGLIAGQKVILCKPMTYMNLSGGPVSQLLSFYKIPPSQTFVFHDELDIGPGRLKVKKNGGSGGHNGIKSLDQHISNEYWRIRIGIGHPGHKDAVSGYVLSNFRKEDEDWLTPLLAAISKEIPSLLEAKDPTQWSSLVTKHL